MNDAWRNKMSKTSYHKVSPQKFVQVISRMPARLAAFLTPYTAEDYESKGANCYLSSNAQSGYVITADAELISVFSLPGARQGAAAVASAVKNGAKKLDCLDTILVQLYSSFGFVEYDRIAWDEQYAPKNWDYEAFGRPDVVFMRHE
jgi:hypothetical protein